MLVTVNGEKREIAAASLNALLGELDYENNHVVIAVNYDVVPRAQWAVTALNSGDEIEIVSMRQGG
ncbi:MAG: sulfur carrier protein ThiS [Pseudorhodoplanes sp.]|jgi:sulfur carrier protein|nr:sulfur carrier protein ThiS [Pseudorhodoplanes sp.]